MKELKLKNEMSSLEVLERINFVRKEMDSKVELAHSDFLKIIRDEFEEEIGEGKISLANYKDKQGKERPMYILTLSQAKQVLVRESKTVRKEVIKYIENLEEMLRQISIRDRQNEIQWQIEREKGKLVRHILTDTIKMKVAESSNKKFMYPNYTKLIYKVLFNKSFDELKKMYNIKPKESLRDYISSEELKELEQMEMLISSLINLGWGYEQIKEFINQSYTKKISA